jgi:hypothetical protein
MMFALAACRTPPWSLRPAQSSRLESFYGAPDEFRLCVSDDRELVAASVSTDLGVTPGINDRRSKPPHCALFEVPAGALDAPTTVTLETRHASGTATETDRLPLTAAGVAWMPRTSFDVATRALFLAPLASGYSDLVELHSAVRYRLGAPLRVGAGLDVRFGAHTAVYATNAVVSTTIPVAARWLTHIDAEYLLGYTPSGLHRDGAEWVHGPSVVLALGYTARRFLGAPSIADSGSVGPALSVEYLFEPNQQHAIWLLGAGFFVHYSP